MTTSPSTAQPEIDPTTIAPNTVVEVESYTTRRALYIRPDGYAYRYDGDECVRVDPDPGHEDEGYSCVTHNCAWDECPANQEDQA